MRTERTTGVQQPESRPAKRRKVQQNNSTDSTEQKDEPDTSVPTSIPALFRLLAHDLFQSPNFRTLLQAITSLDLEAAPKSVQARRFRPGLDYSIASIANCFHHQILDVCFTTVVDDTQESAEGWDRENHGGFESYVEAEDEEDEAAAEVYQENADDGPLLNVVPCHNALSLVLRDRKTLSFVKFVGKGAPSSRVDLKAEWVVVGAAGDEDSEGEGEC